MKRFIVAVFVAAAAPAGAQPFPAEAEVSSPPPVVPLDGGVPAQQEADPAWDSDPDIDGYDAEYSVYYDNVAAQGYDDGYSPNASSYFESTLSPYGTWVDDVSYGRVWTPSSTYVGMDFFPYSTGGRWVLTDYGWTWISDWDWGWAPFHYGRWVTLAGWGWCWVPGTLWGPGWVSWRSGGGYVGWTPLPPAGVRVPPPGGVRPTWRFALANHLGTKHMTYLADRAVPGVFAKTSVVTNLRAVTIGSATVRVNAGPSNIATGTGAGSSLPMSLRTIAPRTLPQTHIAPATGVPLAQRPWVRAGVTGYQAPPVRSIPIGPRSGAPQPIYNAPRGGGIQVYIPSQQRPPAPGPVYRAPAPAYNAPGPVYRAPAPAYNAPGPVYRAPAPAYNAPGPVYRAPAPTYNAPAPMYRAPAPTYHAPAPAPVFRSPAPSYHAPAPAPSRPPATFAPGPSRPMLRR